MLPTKALGPTQLRLRARGTILTYISARSTSSSPGVFETVPSNVRPVTLKLNQSSRFLPHCSYFI